MAVVDEKDKEKILNLFFQRIWSIEVIENHFKGKYTYKEVKAVIKERYNNYGK